MSAWSPPSRTLRLHGLRTLDGSAVRIFLKFAAQQTHQHWELVEDGPVDLLLISPQTTDAHHHLTQAQTAVWVVPKEQDVPQDGRATLTRPLQLDAFFDLLRALGPGGAVPGATSVAHPGPAAAPLAAPAAVAVPASPAPASVPRQPPRYRLRRWPSTELLAKHREYTRLAGFLSARFLSLTELSHLSHADPGICSTFIDLMRLQGLLEERDAALTAAGAPAALHLAGHPPLPGRVAPPAPAASTGLATTATRPGHAPAELLPGFIGRLRERLGIANRQAAAGQH